ncbi:Crp/Fnr family transcriptional regulator [Mucilaginibacter sp.]|uniref:Crp/Fnr family transcriptional regulator n=1 Tax=Mucilaginibacter sp. TaxID=1882438 RepID=UPI003AFF8FBD
MNSDAFSGIIGAINNFCKPSGKEMEEIASYFKIIPLKKDGFFLKEGQVCKNIGFLNSGEIRHFYRAKENDVTRWISFENDFVTSLRSFILQIPSIENLQVLTDCELVVIDRKAFDILIEKNIGFKDFYIKALEYNYITIEDRVFSLIEKSAEERFEWMAKNQLHFIQKVAVMYTASMLGITPRHLSRLRRKFKV